ncbi:nucleotidyltransferase domain-containing protein [Spirosoma linguale]|uniref:Type II CBASS E2 protein domain-containing protein n=1 Tax=Spirosoma linguale (strain ATCC 33905 / DSM 74 / LMG 10896 / Claus 1) TaxID=504472 RepID=D2QQQ6_SPILD|nr:hypothetical protein Slin_4859 [Spirosoma linguale DSM 74]
MLPTQLPTNHFQISPLDDTLNRVAESLQLDPTRRQRIETSYKAVSEWIEKDLTFFRSTLVDIYPQGSIRIDTTVKPYRQSEFDVDFVCHLDFLTGKLHDALEVLDELERRLREHDTYKGRIKRKNRCIRIVYADDFHLDILVGCQELTDNPERLLVPDRQLKDWTFSNPIGYGNWFEQQAWVPQQAWQLLKESYQQRMMVEAAQKLTDPVPYALKPPLKRAVQILKRLRDVYFYNNPDLAASSIVLTTLTGYAYQKQLSIADIIAGWADYTLSRVRYDERRQPIPFEVPNPANPRENFGDKWKSEPTIFKAFVNFVLYLRDTWARITSATNPATRDELLQGLFGYERIQRILTEQRDWTAKVQKLSTLSGLIAAPTLHTKPDVKLTPDPTPIKNQPHRFHGGPRFAAGKIRQRNTVGFYQMHFLEKAYGTTFRCRLENGKLVAEGWIQPHELCGPYKVKIEYLPGMAPWVYIINPVIEPHPAIHMYSDRSLCLHFADDHRWTDRTRIAETTVPWIAEWLVCYEVWLLTDTWIGAEAPHEQTKITTTPIL